LGVRETLTFDMRPQPAPQVLEEQAPACSSGSMRRSSARPASCASTPMRPAVGVRPAPRAPTRTKLGCLAGQPLHRHGTAKEAMEGDHEDGRRAILASSQDRHFAQLDGHCPAAPCLGSAVAVQAAASPVVARAHGSGPTRLARRPHSIHTGCETPAGVPKRGRDRRPCPPARGSKSSEATP